MRKFVMAVALAALAAPAGAAPLCDDLGFAGLLAKCNRGPEIEVTLASGKPLGEGPIALQSGAYYKMQITADGSAELALTGPEFFRAIWMDEIVINDIEVRPMAIDSLEFDDAGTAELSFIAIKPGRYFVLIPGTTGESQRLELTIQ
ncbi:hypothetical protein DDZ14_09135 [Maritimibacter sp. 55A14]|uniref:hypothetical protein n=1 Tax=Maritimibacter sp. 55A14 TaxID=2174844 RepID=UPI000D61FC58|nr:hypothetical protein [Maritimibacter sp. 55A14]PWE32554.1 hypothetical protein DDZ14_09135 [Maritimibacter sp. 55A14]